MSKVSKAPLTSGYQKESSNDGRARTQRSTATRRAAAAAAALAGQERAAQQLARQPSHHEQCQVNMSSLWKRQSREPFCLSSGDEEPSGDDSKEEVQELLVEQMVQEQMLV
jgi:hypothetical protein